MCLEDVWIARHSVARSRGPASANATLPANPGRIALIFSQSFFIVLSSEQGVEIANLRPQVTPQSFNTTATNNAVPTANTGTITVATTEYESGPRILHVRDFGAVLQQSLRIAVAGVDPQLWEVEMDPEFEDALTRKERSWR